MTKAVQQPSEAVTKLFKAVQKRPKAIQQLSKAIQKPSKRRPHLPEEATAWTLYIAIAVRTLSALKKLS